MATIEEISSLLDTKLKSISDDLNALKKDMTDLKDDVKKILRFVSVGNEDILKELEGKKPKLKRAH